MYRLESNLSLICKQADVTRYLGKLDLIFRVNQSVPEVPLTMSQIPAYLITKSDF